MAKTTIKRLIVNMSLFIEDVIRILTLRFVLAPAAYFLPRNWALGIAGVLTLPLVLLPDPGIRVYWQMRSAFGKGRLDSLRLAWSWLARGYRDFVIHKRIIHNYEHPFNWRFVEKNVEHIVGLRESGESYIVATGHFRQASYYCMYSPAITYGHAISVVGEPLTRVRSIRDWRIRYQFGANIGASHSVLGKDVEVILTGSDLSAARKIHRRLCERGNVVFINIDSWWKKSKSGYFERPCAGLRRRGFTTGTALLAQLSKCSIISCCCFEDGDGTITLEWGPPIRIDGMDPDSIIKGMNTLIDRLEIAVADRPTQYAYEIGGERGWNSNSRRW
jgi:lauroyl/myristoyl acyltransferase